MNEFVWFLGVVECTQDPEKLGRVKVRAVGDHTQNKSLIPTDDLPWAMPMMPITSASISGIGQAPLGLVNGSWVVGFYRDGKDKQQPIVMGSIGGLPIDPSDPSIGFNDPIGCFPDESKLNEPDTNRHARGVTGKHVSEPVAVSVRKETVMGGFATGAMTWSEPRTPYEPIYPYNYVWEGPYNPECDTCEWGHIEEWDSTPGSERYFRQHKTSQNFLEIHPDGKEVRKIYGDGFEIDLASKHLYVEGDYRVTINGNKDEHIKGDYWQHIEGNYVQVIDQDKASVVAGKRSNTTYEDVVERTKKDLYSVAEGNLVRMANESIHDSAGDTCKSVAVNENTIATGSYAAVVVDEIPPVVVNSDSMPEVILSCKEANQAIVTIANNITPEIPDFNIIASGVADTQIKIIPTTIFVDSEYTHILSENFIKEDTHFNKNVLIKEDLDVVLKTTIGDELHVESSAYIGGDCNAIGDVYAGGNVEVGAELHAIAPIAVDPVVEHDYIVPTAGAAPTAPETVTEPDPYEETPKIVIDKTVDIPEEVYTPNDKFAVPYVPGEIQLCE